MDRNQGIPFLTFSFKYFGQQDYFGVGDMDASWFANLLDRIKDLSNKTVRIIDDPNERISYRLNLKGLECGWQTHLRYVLKMSLRKGVSFVEYKRRIL